MEKSTLQVYMMIIYASANEGLTGNTDHNDNQLLYSPKGILSIIIKADMTLDFPLHAVDLINNVTDAYDAHVFGEGGAG